MGNAGVAGELPATSPLRDTERFPVQRSLPGGSKIRRLFHVSRLVFTVKIHPPFGGRNRLVGARRRALPCAATWAPQLDGSLALIFYDAWTGPQGATIGVLVSGVPWSTCCAAQLRPSFINNDKFYID